MSQRDLPLWARAATALLLLGAGWWAARTEPLVLVVGDSVVEVSAAVVAVSVIVGIQVPLGIWPRAPERARFSLVAALAASLAMAALIVFSGPSGLPAEFLRRGRGAIPVLLLGGAAWAVGWGRTRQRPFGRWYAAAAGCAALTLLGGVIVSAMQGRLPPVQVLDFLRTASFFAVAGATGALITQELAFRRLLVGQSGEAGLVVVAGSALVFGAWHAVIPTGGGAPVHAIAAATLNGVILASLYLLSRSLLIPAVFHGLQIGLLKGIQTASEAAVGATGLGQGMWIPNLIGSAAVAGLLAVQVVRQNGLLGPITLRRAEIDAPGD